MSEWIKIEDKWPELEKVVLVFVCDNRENQENKFIYIAETAEFVFFDICDHHVISKYGSGKVTHWMPLPDFPVDN